MMEWLKKTSFESPLKLAVLVFFIVSIGVISLSFWFYDTEFYENILVEAHGMLFDLLILGVFVYWLNSLGERERNIKRYQEEIDDYLGWEAPEAIYRIIGNIKRLNREKVTNIHLRRANLSRANLNGIKLRGANLGAANLCGAYLIGSDLSKANLAEANLSKANLSAANLQEATLREANLRKSIFIDTNLKDANLIGANLNGAIIRGANFKRADLWEADLRATDLCGVDLMDARLENAMYNDRTQWQKGFDPKKAGALFVDE